MVAYEGQSKTRGDQLHGYDTAFASVTPFAHAYQIESNQDRIDRWQFHIVLARGGMGENRVMTKKKKKKGLTPMQSYTVVVGGFLRLRWRRERIRQKGPNSVSGSRLRLKSLSHEYRHLDLDRMGSRRCRLCCRANGSVDARGCASCACFPVPNLLALLLVQDAPRPEERPSQGCYRCYDCQAHQPISKDKSPQLPRKTDLMIHMMGEIVRKGEW